MTETPSGKSQPISSVRNSRRIHLRELNTSTWDGVQGVFATAKNLDSTLKKNTAFIKRCRVNLNEDSQKSLLNDIANVSLEKYLSEILGALCEGFIKCKSSADLFTGVEVASALHQRFSRQFSPQLLAYFFQGIANPQKGHLDSLLPEARLREDQARIDRQKIVLRILVELWLVNVFRGTSDVVEAGFEVPRWALTRNSDGIIPPPPLSALEEVLNYDLENFSGASIAVVLLKNYGLILTGVSKPKEDAEGEKEENGDVSTAVDDATSSETPLIFPDVQKLFFRTFQSYTLSLQAKLKEMARHARKIEKQNGDAYIRSGKILSERKEGLDNLLAKFQSLHIHCTTLSEYLGIPMPDYKTTNEVEEGVLISLGNVSDEDGGLWDDDEQKKFYEDLIDLSYLGEKEGEEGGDKEREREGEKEGEGEGEGGKEIREEEKEIREEEEDSDSDSDSEVKDREKIDEKDQKLIDELDNIMTTNESDQSDDKEIDDSKESDFDFENQTDIPSEPTAGTRIAELLTSLSTQQSRAHVDKMAIEFIPLNNKASRNKIIQFLTNIPITEQYKLPFYCRFIATLDPFCKDITIAVLEYIENFFRYLQRHRKSKRLTSRRIFITRYFGELVKFSIVPKHTIFHKLKIIITNLDDSNVENLFTMFECCGRYLMRKPDTHLLMTKMIEVLEYQKDKKYFSVDVKAMINGALQYINPPPKVENIKERSIIEQYIRKLIYYDLSKETSTAILMQLRRMDFNDKDTFQALRKVFTKIWKVKYVNISYMAWFLGNFVSSYRSFVVIIVDALLENIRRGLETNSFEFNQKRISEIIFLAELSRYRIVSEETIFDVLFLLITFGHPNGQPSLQYCELDPPNEFFRIRLICTLLESSGVSARLSKDVKKFNLLIMFLQYYIFTKESMSMDIEFQVRDTFEVLEIKLAKTPQEAAIKLQDAIKKFNGIEEKVMSDEEAEADLSAELLAVTQGQEDQTNGNSEQIAEEDEIETEEERFEREEQERIQKLEAKRVHAAKEDIKAMAQVEREFQKLMVDRMDRKTDEKITKFDEPVPFVRTESTPAAPIITNNSKVAYKLLTKKVGKAQMVDVNVPSDSKFAINVESERNRLQHEHNKIRDFVLSYEYDSNEPKIRKIVQPNVQSTRYSRLKKKAPTIDDIKL